MFNEIPKNCQYCYARVSSKSQKDNSSLEAQNEEFIQQEVPKKNIRSKSIMGGDQIKKRGEKKRVSNEQEKKKKDEKQRKHLILMERQRIRSELWHNRYMLTSDLYNEILKKKDKKI